MGVCNSKLFRVVFLTGCIDFVAGPFPETAEGRDLSPETRTTNLPDPSLDLGGNILIFVQKILTRINLIFSNSRSLFINDGLSVLS